MQSRLESPWGSRIDRSKSLAFSFEGETIKALPGDTIASALAANGRWMLSRSFKYHRPRGVLTMAGHDANTLVQLSDEPNVRADLRQVRDGMKVSAQNVKGSLKRDRGAILDSLGRFMPVGFYYRSFFRPGSKSWLKFWEPVIRKSAGLGVVDLNQKPARYEKRNLHCDVLIVGAGPSGLAAALSAADAGADVLVVDQSPEVGGALTYARFAADRTYSEDTLGDLRARVAGHENISVLTNATCNGWFADNWLPVIQGNTLNRVRAKEVVVATGSHEQPLIFRNNDLPGIMLSSAAQRLMRHYGVCPGQRAVVFAGNRDGYLAALDLMEAGVQLAAVLDPHDSPVDMDIADYLSGWNVRIVSSACIEEARGGRGNTHVKALRVSQSGGATETISCDLVVFATGYTPGYQLPLQAGAKLGYDDATRQFTVSNIPDHMHVAGSAEGMFDLGAVMRSGEIAGAQAAIACGLSAKIPAAIADATAEQMNYCQPLTAHPKGRDFIDFDEDLQVKDIRNAVADGYNELELVKRYSTVGMGPSQGRHSALTTARIVAAETARKVGEVGITTARPPFGPEKLGLLAGPHLVPYRHTPMHRQHLDACANMMPVGAWWRPQYYGDSQNAQQIIQDEARNVRECAGMLDVSTLGGLAIRGADAGRFLDRIYTMAHAKQPVGRVRYCLMLNEMGSVVDDGVAYRLAEDEFYVTATTGAVARVFADMLWWNAQWRMDVDIQNVTAAFAGINVTGPKARDVLQALDGDIDLSKDSFKFLEGRTGTIAGCPVRVMRIGFTGELSFELHTPQSYGPRLWAALLEHGAPQGLKSYGLEASRILRLEKGHIIIGQDTDALTTADELGMEWALSRKKPDYLGKTAIETRRGLEQKRRLCGFELPKGHGVKVQESSLVLRDGHPVGFVSSVCLSPTLDKWVGLAYAHPADAAPGGAINIRGVCGRNIEAAVVSPLFFDPENTRQEI